MHARSSLKLLSLPLLFLLPQGYTSADQRAVAPHPAADAHPPTLYTNAGSVWTGDLEGGEWAEAFVVGSDGRFLYVGSSQEAVARAGVGAPSVDLGGRTVIPVSKWVQLPPWNGRPEAHVLGRLERGNRRGC